MKRYVVDNIDKAKKFDSTIGKGKWLVLYHADWCGHCQRFKPVWDGLKESLKTNMAEIEVSYQDHADFSTVQGFPTIVLIENGSRTLYQGDRNPESIQTFVQGSKQTGKGHGQKLKRGAQPDTAELIVKIINTHIKPGELRYIKRIYSDVESGLVDNMSEYLDMPRKLRSAGVRSLSDIEDRVDSIFEALVIWTRLNNAKRNGYEIPSNTLYNAAEMVVKEEREAIQTFNRKLPQKYAHLAIHK